MTARGRGARRPPGWPRGGSESPSARPGEPVAPLPPRATGSPRSAVVKGRAGGPAGLHPGCAPVAGAHASAVRDAWLPVGVVPAAVLGVSSHPAWWAAYTTTSQNPAAAAAASTSAQQV
jgi:hypothetical protein